MSSARKAPSPTVVIFGQQEHRGRLDVRSRPRRRGPGASTGVIEAGVEREEQRAGRVEEPLGGPHLPAHASCAPGRCPHGSRRRAAGRRRGSGGRGCRTPPRWPAGRRGAPATAASPSVAVLAHRGADHARRRPAPPTSGQRTTWPTELRRRRRATHRRPGRALVGPRRLGLALPASRRAGPARTRRGPRPTTADPARPRRRRPTRAPGSRVLREPDGGAGARRARGRGWSLVAVEPVAGQVDLGLDRRAVAERQEAGDRRQAVQVDALADRRPEGTGVVGDPRARRRGSTAPAASISCSAAQSRTCTWPPAGSDPGRRRAGAGARPPPRCAMRPNGDDQHHATRRRPTTTTRWATHASGAGPGEEAVERERATRASASPTIVWSARVSERAGALRGPRRAPHPRRGPRAASDLAATGGVDVLGLARQPREGVHVGDGRPAGSGVRRADTSWAAARLPPPSSKKSASGVRRRARRARRSTALASHATVPPRAEPPARRRRARRGQRPGSALGPPCPRCGWAARRRWRARAPARPGGVARSRRGRGRQVERRAGPARGSRPAPGCRRRSSARRRAAAVTPGSAWRAASTSPSSIRRPPSFTCSSARPTNTRPAGSCTTRSPLR